MFTDQAQGFFNVNQRGGQHGIAPDGPGYGGAAGNRRGGMGGMEPRR